MWCVCMRERPSQPACVWHVVFVCVLNSEHWEFGSRFLLNKDSRGSLTEAASSQETLTQDTRANLHTHQGRLPARWDSDGASRGDSPSRLALNENKTPPTVSFLLLALFLSPLEHHEDKRRCLDTRVQWQRREKEGAWGGF